MFSYVTVLQDAGITIHNIKSSSLHSLVQYLEQTKFSMQIKSFLKAFIKLAFLIV